MKLNQTLMTPRERWRAVFEHQIPDRIPMDYWGTAEITEKLMFHFGCDTRSEMLSNLHVDFVVGVSPVYIGPLPPKGEDIFGRKGVNVNYGTGSYWEITHNPLSKYKSVKEIEENYRWPEPAWWDYSTIPSQVEGWDEYPVRGGGSEPFLIYKELRGQQQALIDLVENPEIVEYVLSKLFELAYQDTLRIFEVIPDRVDFSYVAEDLGGQTNLLFSPSHIREFLFPGMKKMIDLIHSAGSKVFHHDDGNISKILPELVDLGIDILNPIQWRADGMDRDKLKATYGNQLVFHGGMDNQYTLPFGTIDDVINEVQDNIDILGKSGGYILAPCHNIQAVTPVENIVAMYNAGYEMGRM